MAGRSANNHAQFQAPARLDVIVAYEDLTKASDSMQVASAIKNFEGSV